MAGRPRLKLLAAGVLAAHLAALDWFAAEMDHGSILKPTTTPMFTRMLQPQAPPPVAAAPAPPPPPRRVRPKPPPEVAIATQLPAPEPEPSVPETVTPTVAEVEPDPVPPAEPAPANDPPTAVAAASPASAAASAPDPAPLASWPTDTRLDYRLSGLFRQGELYGDARVQWQREGGNYQVRLDIDIRPWVTMVITSQGEVTEGGLLPRAYEEERVGKRRAARFGERALQLEHGKTAPRPDGMQDTASQFVELAHRFATGQATLEVGRTVSFWMARPGAVDYWTYDIVARETLKTALGPVEAFHLKPRPIANPRGNVTAEMWFAPSLQYLPVRIKVNMGEQNHVDLLVEKIEQR